MEDTLTTLNQSSLMEILQTSPVPIRNRNLPSDKMLHISPSTLDVCTGVYVGVVFRGWDPSGLMSMDITFKAAHYLSNMSGTFGILMVNQMGNAAEWRITSN